MAGNQQTRIPNVPLRTPMFDDGGNITRTWVIFFERLAQAQAAGEPPPFIDTDTDLYHRTLLLKDSTVGNDIADHVTVYAPGSATRIVGILRKAISSALTVRVNHKARLASGFTSLVTISIPADTAVNVPIEKTAADFSVKQFNDGDVFSWDVTASDGQTDVNGVASFTLAWSWEK